MKTLIPTILLTVVFSFPVLAFASDPFFDSLRNQPSPLQQMEQREQQKQLRDQTKALQGIQEELRRQRIDKTTEDDLIDMYYRGY